MSIKTVYRQLKTTAETASDVIKTCKDCYQILQQIIIYGKHIPYLGPILIRVEDMLPVDDSKKVSYSLEKLDEHIKAGIVRDDIRELDNKMTWETAMLQYSDSFTKIETGMEFLLIILSSMNDARRNAEERLKELCSNQAMTLAMKTLLKGLTEEDMLHKDILGTIYLYTRGHRRRIESMHNRFLELFTGGTAVIAEYEKLVRGDEAALEIAARFKNDTAKLITRFDTFQQKCKDHFSENMLADLNEILAGHESNKDAAASLSKFLRDKYDWLEIYCVIFKANDCIDYNFSGLYIKSKEHNGRFGVVFYKDGIEDPAIRKFQKTESRQARRLNDVVKLIKETDRDCGSSDVAKINRTLKKRLIKNGFNLWGCATAKAKGKISNCFEISGSWTKAVSHVGDPGGHEYLCLLK